MHVQIMIKVLDTVKKKRICTQPTGESHLEIP